MIIANRFINYYTIYSITCQYCIGGSLCGNSFRIGLNNVNPANVDVGIETFCNAVEIGEYYREQAIYAYSLGDVDTATLKAERVIDRIRAKNIRISGLVNSVKSTICHFMVCIVSDTYLHRFL